jgi:hypothetical protein
MDIAGRFPGRKSCACVPGDMLLDAWRLEDIEAVTVERGGFRSEGSCREDGMNGRCVNDCDIKIFVLQFVFTDIGMSDRSR